MEAIYGTGVTADELKGLDREEIVQEFLDDALDAYAEREKEIDEIEEGCMRDLERFIVLQTVDIRWREHLENMDYMREGSTCAASRRKTRSSSTATRATACSWS